MALEVQENIRKNHGYVIPEKLPANVFRTYDIRGEANVKGITPDLAYAIGQAVASEVLENHQHELIVGRDGRLSGPELKKALIQGIMDAGCDVIDIGVVPTPVVYFATNCLKSNSGIMVTASHNPKHHNGFKIVLFGKTLTTDGVQGLYQRIKSRQFKKGQGSISQYDIVSEYMDYIKKSVTLSRPLKVAIDCGNGAASEIAPQLFRDMGCELIELFCEIDGNFPNHHPDPTVPSNLKQLIDTVKTSDVDIGLAFDGDADRLGVVTNKGEIIWPDRQLMLFAKDVLSRIPDADIVFDVKCSKYLPKIIEENGGHPIMYRTGHSLIKSKMHEINAPLAGEMSGHIFFKENWFGFDDGIYVAARLLQILSENTRSSSEIFHDFPNSVNTPELKLAMPEEDKQSFMQQLLDQGDFGNGKRITIDGLRVEFDNAWGLVRPSNTSPNLILRFEADTENHLQEIQTIFRRELLKIEPTLKLPF